MVHRPISHRLGMLTEEVPTYNYTAIQVKGTRRLRDRTETDDDLKRLVNYYEQKEPKGLTYDTLIVLRPYYNQKESLVFH